MITAWEFGKRHVEWVYILACWGLGVWTWLEGDVVGALICFGIGLALYGVFCLINRLPDKPKVIEPKRSGGTLPPPPPSAPDTVKVMLSPGSNTVEPHYLGSHTETCTYCRDWKGGSPE